MANVSKRGNSFQIRVSCGYSSEGKQIMRCLTWTPDKSLSDRQINKELQKKIIEFENQCLQGQTSSYVKFEAFANQWFEEYAKINMRSTTIERMKQLKNRTYKFLGHIYIGKMTIRDVQNFVNFLSTSAKSESNGQPLSRKTVVHYLSFVSDVLSYAVRLNIIHDNPCRNVVIPKNLEGTHVKSVYSIEETILFLEQLDKLAPVKYNTFFKLLIFGGLRRSEALGLEWKDINFKTNFISIRRASNYTKEKGIYTDKTKTRNSERIIQLPDELILQLKNFKSEQDIFKAELGSKWVENDRIFIKWNGEPMNNQTPYGWLKEFCEKQNLPFYGIHTFRHLHASLLINAGVDIVAVSNSLGHSNVSTTLNIYSHAFNDMKSKTCAAISESLKLK